MLNPLSLSPKKSIPKELLTPPFNQNAKRPFWMDNVYFLGWLKKPDNTDRSFASFVKEICLWTPNRNGFCDDNGKDT